MQAEYIATTECDKEAMWLKGLIGELGLVQDKGEVFRDNKKFHTFDQNLNFLLEDKTHRHQTLFHLECGLMRDNVGGKIYSYDNLMNMVTKLGTIDKFKYFL